MLSSLRLLNAIRKITSRVALDAKMTNDFMSDASPQELFDLAGNDPQLWARRAEALLSSSEVLDAQYPGAPQEDFDAFWEFFKLHSVSVMLKGMAIECLLKAIWVGHVSPLAANGKFQSIAGVGDHDLLAIATALGKHLDLGLSREDMELLPVLSFAITSGRYPIPKGFDKRPSKPDWKQRIKWCKWEIPSDRDRFSAMVSKLLRHIDTDT